MWSSASQTRSVPASTTAVSRTRAYISVSEPMSVFRTGVNTVLPLVVLGMTKATFGEIFLNNQAPRERCCCADDLCNFNSDLMAPHGVIPTPNPATNNRLLSCLDGIQFTIGERTPVTGESRPCSGACSYADIDGDWNEWRCLDSDVCASLGISLGACKYGVIGFSQLCCFVNSTAVTTTSTSRSTMSSTRKSTTTTPGTCPPAWSLSATVSQKCYLFDGTSPVGIVSNI